jgi:hypothetical protein
MLKNLHTLGMFEENRRDVRYDEIGRVISPDLCALPGILDNISSGGCKVHFPLPIVVDLENEYELKIFSSRPAFQEPLKLICQPQWVKEIDGMTEIGFRILYSPDAVRLSEFVAYLEKLSKDILPDIN